jgi:hypothetical protein
MALITIGSTPLPDPVEYSVSLQDIDSENTRRTEAGILTRDRVRGGVYKIQITWKVTKTQLKTITDAISPAQFSVTFFDPTTSTDPTKYMYSGDRTGKLILLKDPNNPSSSLWELSTSLIEY